MKKAIVKAGWKLGGGLLLVGAVIGVRIVTADPDGIEGEIEQLDALEAELSAETEARREAASVPVEEDREGPEADGLVARMSATVRASLRGQEPGPDPNRVVRCDLGGGIQFTRAADCQSRGGDITDVGR